MRYTEPGATPAALPPGVTQAMVDASLAANPNASLGGYVGAGPSYNPVANQPPPAPAAGGSALAQLIHAMRNAYTPDYQALLQSDPQLLQAQTDVRAQLGSAAATRKAATAKILAQLGLVPDFGSALNQLGLNSSYLGEDVDPTVQGLARTMTEQGLSTEAQLGRQHEALTNSLVDMLAARGTLRSGGLGVGLTSEGQRHKQAEFDALQTALGQIGAAQGGYNQTLQGTTDTLRTAADTAVQRQIQLHPAVAGAQVDATYDPATGLYKDADGNLYNADGTATKAGAANAQPVHPSNVAAPIQTAAAVPAATVPAPAAAAPAALPNQGAGPYIGSNNAPVYNPVPKATIPAAPPALPNQGAGPYIGSQNAPTYTPAPAAAAAPVPAAAPVRATAWSNSVLRRLNLPD